MLTIIESFAKHYIFHLHGLVSLEGGGSEALLYNRHGSEQRKREREVEQ
jgi:hypothetical protein